MDGISLYECQKIQIGDFLNISDIFCYGALGGVLAEFLIFWKHRFTPADQLPMDIHSLRYWGTVVGMSVMGGSLALAYSSNATIPPILAINIGVSAPLIIGNWSASIPKVS